MGKLAIQVENLGKEYRIGARQEIRTRLSEQMVDAFVSPFRRMGKLLRGQLETAAELEESLWALKEIGFSIRHGEAVGIVGANGAGKSTLLKILSRITEPTEGSADIYGRIGSLLEVGTGFHPELTGRENTYMNGAILGMRKHEVDRKFDEIVDFSGLEKFIDTPIKHYSSGMYVRLAFAVAAHLEPDILLVDEVLAVGDVEFQRKCLGKMEDVASTGRTVLFVSHNMGLIQTLCTRGIFLKEGRVAMDGDVEDAVSAYLRSFEQYSQARLADRTDRTGKGEYRVLGLEIFGPDGERTNHLKTGRPARFVFQLNKVTRQMYCSFTFYDPMGRPLAHLQSSVKGEHDVYDPAYGTTFTCEFDQFLLLPGTYRVDVAVEAGGIKQDAISAAARIEVVESFFDGRRMWAPKGVFAYIPHRWHIPLNRS